MSPRSECRCQLASCEPSSQGQRFMMVKEGGINGCITDRIDLDGIEYLSGHTLNEIANCEMKTRFTYKDREGEYQPKNNYCDKGGHKDRSLDHDHRKKGHKDHWRKETKRRYNLD